MMPVPYFRQTGTAGGAIAIVLLLSGCLPTLSSMGNRDEPATMQGFSPSDPALATPAKGGSAIIDALKARQSVLRPGGPYAAIADAVVQASSGAAEAELRMARLKAEAQAKNWLPTIGPTVSLTSLGTVMAQLVVDQAILDNGRRKAERDYAAADVEVAAVSLSRDMNGRVHDGIAAYINAERARAQADVAERAVARLLSFEDIVTMRVQGGLSDRSEQQVIAQTRSEMQATMAADRQTVVQSMADLAALTHQPVDGLMGLDVLPVDAGHPEALSVMLARAEGARAVAQAKAARAGLLPGLNAAVGIDQEGNATPGMTLGGAQLGLGSFAQAKAMNATPDLVERRTAEAQEAANRQFTANGSDIAALQLRQAQGAEVLRQTLSNLDLFTEQYKLGRRTLLELVSQYESAARLERDQVSIGFDIALLQLRMAQDRGLLIDGARM